MDYSSNNDFTSGSEYYCRVGNQRSPTSEGGIGYQASDTNHLLGDSWTLHRDKIIDVRIAEECKDGLSTIYGDSRLQQDLEAGGKVGGGERGDGVVGREQVHAGGGGQAGQAGERGEPGARAPRHHHRRVVAGPGPPRARAPRRARVQRALLHHGHQPTDRYSVRHIKYTVVDM